MSNIDSDTYPERGNFSNSEYVYLLPVNFSKSPVPISNGRSSMIVHQLNKSCMIAAEKPNLYSSIYDKENVFNLTFYCDRTSIPKLWRLVRDTIVDVIDVPTLLPIITGIPSLSVMILLAAIATTTEVVADEDYICQDDEVWSTNVSTFVTWIMAVEMTPSMRPIIGFDIFCEARKLVVRLEHNRWKESLNIDKEHIKKNRKKIIENDNRIIFTFWFIFTVTDASSVQRLLQVLCPRVMICRL